MLRLLKKFWFLLLLSPVLIWFSWHIFYLAISENLEVKKGSLDYYLTIQFSTLQKLQLIGKIEEEKYYSDCGDGPKLPQVWVNYKSNVDKNFAIKIFEDYLFENGFKKNEKISNANEFFYDKNNSETIYIYIYSLTDGNNFIEIRELYN